MDNREWFKQAKYGMMAHWGLYSLLAGEYRGQPSSEYAEWIQSYFRIPNAEYGALAQAFNPLYFNADEWIRLAKRCGMQYFVLTSKHHDGFALFHSRWTSTTWWTPRLLAATSWRNWPRPAISTG